MDITRRGRYRRTIRPRQQPRLLGLKPRVSRAQVRPIVNGEVTDWSRQLEDGQTVAFLPPVAGG